LYRFAGGSDGEGPSAGLLAVNGTLYGTTTYGGGSGCGSHPEGCGTIYRTSTTGSEKVLYRFGTRHRDDGAYPIAELMDVDGVLYGTTLEGGVGCRGRGGCGIVYRVTTAGSETVLYRFRGYPDGENPAAPLIDVDGMLYGTTSSGGTQFAYGTVFTLMTSGQEHVVFSFAGQEGEVPTGSLINVHGDLYGTTARGGSGCPAGNHICGRGTIYRLTTASSDVVLHNFAGGSDGQEPGAGLTEANGTLYGTTERGGRGCGLIGCGTVFALTP
jgi:uncharacterized repeat protein (TIGR03803 family)